MKRQLKKAFLLLATIFVFDEFAHATWHLVDAAAGGFRAGWLGVLLVAVGAGALFLGRHRLNSLGDSAAGWIIPTIFDSQLHPPSQSRRERRWLGLGISLAALSVATGVAWVVSALNTDHEWLILAGALVAVGGLFGLKVSHSKADFRLVRRTIGTEFEVLVMFLSVNGYLTKEIGPGDIPRHAKPTGRTSAPTEDELKAAFARAPGEAHDSWLIPMLSIRHQASRGRLHRVLVIPSTRSVLQWEAFEDLVNAWFPDRQFTLEKIGSGTDYTSLVEVWEHVNDGFAKAGGSGGSQVIDITGGMALCSVAGAIATLVPGRVFKYVDTNTYEEHGFRIQHAFESDEVGE